MFVVYSIFHPEGETTRFEHVNVDGVTDTQQKALQWCCNLLFDWLADISQMESLEFFMSEQAFDISSDYSTFQEASKEIADQYFEEVFGFETGLSDNQYQTAQALIQLSDNDSSTLETLRVRLRALCSIRDDIFNAFFECEIGLYVGYREVQVTV